MTYNFLLKESDLNVKFIIFCTKKENTKTKIGINILCYSSFIQLEGVKCKLEILIPIYFLTQHNDIIMKSLNCTHFAPNLTI